MHLIARGRTYIKLVQESGCGDLTYVDLDAEADTEDRREWYFDIRELRAEQDHMQLRPEAWPEPKPEKQLHLVAGRSAFSGTVEVEEFFPRGVQDQSSTKVCQTTAYNRLRWYHFLCLEIYHVDPIGRNL